MRRSVILLTIMLSLTACGSADPYAKLSSATVSSFGVVKTLEESWGYPMKMNTNIGVIVTDTEGKQLVYFPDRQALMYVGWLEGIFFELHPGYRVYSGKTRDVAKAVKEGTVTVSLSPSALTLNGAGMHAVILNFEAGQEPSVYYFKTRQPDEWSYIFSGENSTEYNGAITTCNRMFSDLTEAYNAAIGQP